MIDRADKDIHVLKYFSAFVSVSNGKVFNVTDPSLISCPLARHLYGDFRKMSAGDKESVKEAIKNAVESKIKDYGFFTVNRKLSCFDVSVPFGASEMLMFALRKKAIQAAVVVCEGAGTVIVYEPEVVQGIGARMNSLLLTSPIRGIIQTLKTAGCEVVFDNAVIDQIRGVKKALSLGYKVIAVTVAGHLAEDLKALRRLEKESGVKIISLVVCTTGITKDKVAIIRDHADLVWSCASLDIREAIGPLAKLQLSKAIPVFVLTDKGIDFVSSYAREPEFINNLDFNKQYLICGGQDGIGLEMGGFRVFLNAAKLPVSSRRVPVFENNEKRGICDA